MPEAPGRPFRPPGPMPRAGAPQAGGRVSGSAAGREVIVETTEGTLDASGGLALSSGDGREVADQTFEARMDRLWDRVRGEVMSILGELPGAEK